MRVSKDVQVNPAHAVRVSLIVRNLTNHFTRDYGVAARHNNKLRILTAIGHPPTRQEAGEKGGAPEVSSRMERAGHRRKDSPRSSNYGLLNVANAASMSR